MKPQIRTVRWLVLPLALLAALALGACSGVPAGLVRLAGASPVSAASDNSIKNVDSLVKVSALTSSNANPFEVSPTSTEGVSPTPGESLTPTPEASPSPVHGHEFDLKGIVSAINGSVWSINGQDVLTDSNTIFKGSPTVGDFVEAEGSLQADGSWLARQISKEDHSEGPLGTPNPSATPEGEHHDLPHATSNPGDGHEDHPAMTSTPNPSYTPEPHSPTVPGQSPEPGDNHGDNHGGDHSGDSHSSGH